MQHLVCWVHLVIFVAGSDWFQSTDSSPNSRTETISCAPRPSRIFLKKKNKKQKKCSFQNSTEMVVVGCCGWWKKCLAAYLNQIKYTKYIGIMELLCAGPAKIWFSFRIFLNCTTFLSIHCTHVFQRMTCSRLSLNNFLCLWDYDSVNFYFFSTAVPMELVIIFKLWIIWFANSHLDVNNF